MRGGGRNSLALLDPILDMKAFIDCMEEKDELYYEWVLQHQIDHWQTKTFILRPETDFVVNNKVHNAFISRFVCNVVTIKDGEHWFHTPKQLSIMSEWEECVLTGRCD